MKRISRTNLSILLALLLVGCGAACQAFTTEQVSTAKDYAKHVPETMRELVPEEKYQKVLSELIDLQDPVAGGNLLSLQTIVQIAASPCSVSLTYLATQYATDPETRKALTETNNGFHDLPAGYAQPNPWKGHKDATELVRQMLGDFTTWCTFLPDISGSEDNGLKYIQYFAWFYYRNPAGRDFVQGRHNGKPLLTGLKFTKDFSKQRGIFMDSKASAVKVAQWVNDPRIEINDYLPGDDNTYHYTSWNDFFARRIKVDPKTRTIPSRPVTMPLSEYPDRDYIVVSPTDCIMNPLVQVLQEDGSVVREYLENPLQKDTVLDVKNIPVDLMDLLGSAPTALKQQFIGGTGLSCVLMPNTYHHFHSPVNGEIVHAEIVSSGTYGYQDFPNWAPLDGNVGRPGTDFSQFQDFQRGVIIIEVKYKDLDGKELTGYVASIPVGLNTIGSVVLDKEIRPGKTVKRGYTRLGNFLYGGSLDILLFSKGLATGAVQTRLGTQITLFNVGRAPGR